MDVSLVTSRSSSLRLKHLPFFPLRTTSVAYHQILIHAHSVNLYRAKYQSQQKGRIGITLNIDWVVPIDESKEAKDAADLAVAMALGWVSSGATEVD
jgi:beta-glucosidase/6-phospho-beta-glucosidase/beta-galactosidase